MPLYLQVKLTEGEKKELLKLKQAVSTPERTRSRIETLTRSQSRIQCQTDSDLNRSEGIDD